jgi:hypothetical protein
LACALSETLRRFDIHFWRDGKDTLFKVLKGSPTR